MAEIETETGKKWLRDFQGSEQRMRERIIAIEQEIKASGSTGTTADIYTVKRGDNLSLIAGKFYGDPNDWRRIYDANKSVIGPNPDLIHPGQRLIIP